MIRTSILMVVTRCLFIVAIVVVATIIGCLPSTPAHGFGIPKAPRCRFHASDSTLHMFDNFKGAFENDKTLGKAENAGLKNGPRTNDNVTMNGKAVKAIVGQKVSVVANSARVKISYNCRQGDCGTCMIKMNGKKVKACQQVIPSGKCTMETL